MRLALLPCGHAGERAGEPPSLLPLGTSLQDVLQGTTYTLALPGSLTLHFQDLAAESQPNRLASRASGLHVRGDAVLALPKAASAADATALLATLAGPGRLCARGLRTRRPAPPPSSASSDRRASHSGGTEAPAPPTQHAAHSPDWSLLRPEVLAEVVRAGGYTSTFAQTVAQVCGAWRSGMHQDQSVLQRLQFSRLRAAAGQSIAQRARLPRLVQLASAAGNPLASLVAARWLHATGDAGAVHYWRQAGKHPEAQFRLGYAAYKGTSGLDVDSDQALMWLTRALRQLQEEAAPLPALMAPQECQALLGRTACILAGMHLDGEATSPSTEQAIKLLRLAVDNGCPDSGLMLGSLLNTGQY